MRNNWISELKNLYERDISAANRLDNMIFLRKNLFPSVNKSQSESVISCLALSTVELLMDFCYRLFDWPLLVYCCNEHLKRSSGIEHLRLLSLSFRQLGLIYQAESILSDSLIESGAHELKEDYLELQKIIYDLPDGWDTLNSGSLVLTPLQTWHEQDFFSQYTDPRIAEMCVLPDFTKGEDDWRQWLQRSQLKENENLFAVIHRNWGVIGSVSLEMFQETGFFYFWLGPDFQGQGYGPEAVNMLLDWGRRYLDLKYCYTKVYEDNVSSQKALEKLGFWSLPFEVTTLEAIEQDDACMNDEYLKEYLYYRGESRSDQELLIIINRFLANNSPESRAVPVDKRYAIIA